MRLRWRRLLYQLFQSTPPARGATLQVPSMRERFCISIHAPREGGDSGQERGAFFLPDFNPRPPRGGRPRKTWPFRWQDRFQSTPPARGATGLCDNMVLFGLISIHAPREGGDAIPADAGRWAEISIHAPREGGDFVLYRPTVAFRDISIHAPREGGDFHDDLIRYTDYISIHAPREGGDIV